MKKNGGVFLSIFVLFWLITGCDLLTGEDPEVRITDRSGVTWNNLWYSQTVTIRNTTATSTAYSVIVYAKMKSGNYVIASGSGYGGTLEAEEYKTVTVTMSPDVKSGAMGTVSLTLVWYDENNKQFTEEY